ncbi:MAG TPA: caspase family protein [Gemmatimonadaceae bacterium]|nr:caspase family protein [Gemmatimonadaceae bacterium]
MAALNKTNIGVAFAGAALAFALTGFAGSSQRERQRAPRHLSLLIGAGNYKFAGEWKDLRNLKGPRTDVRRMQHTLRRWGFRDDPSSQRVLVDQQASKAGMEDAFRWLASQATDSGDVVVIYYSGHGSWAPDASIDAIRTLDEARSVPGDTFDEGLVPWDARDPHNARQLLLDDEINALLARLGTGNVTMIVDACFSGTITRGSPDTSSTAPVARGPRPPPFVALGSSEILEAGRRPTHTLLTAASSSQLAYEKAFHPGAVVSGVFTRHLAEALDGASPSTRFDDLLQQVRTKVGQGQTPQLEGDRTARIFKVGAGAKVPARGYSLVVGAGSGRVGLDAGALHGVRFGAVYDVFGPGETEFQGGRLAQVQVDSIFEASSFARILPGASAIPRAARATLSRVPVGAMALDRLRVFVNPSARALRDSLGRVEWIQITDQPGRAMAELRRRGDAYQLVVEGHELPPLLGDISSGRATPVGPDSVRGYHGDLRALCAPLRRAYSIAAMSLIRNDQPPPNLKVDVRVLPAGSGPPSRRALASVDTMLIGRRYDIWVWVEIPDEAVQRSSLYLTVGFAGYSGAPAVIWPRTPGQARLTPEQLNGPVLLRGGVSPSLPEGIESIKAVVSSDPYNLHSLMSGLPRCPFAADATRDVVRGAADADEAVVTGWTAATRRVEIYSR